MNLIKLIIKVTFIVMSIMFISNPTLSFYFYQWKTSFALFVILAIIDGLKVNYVSFLFDVIGLILFNPFNSLQLGYVMYLAVIRWSIGFINAWVLIDLYYMLNKKKDVSEERILKFLKLNETTGLYEVFDGVYKYEISGELIENLKVYMFSSKIKLIGDWYIRLTKEERKKVRKTSRLGPAI